MLNTAICKHIQKHNKACDLLHTTGGKDEPTMFFMQKS